MRLPVIDVAVNIVRAPDGRVLLAERTPRQVAAGFWELPGGKIDAGETPAQAAARELDEEIGIQPHGLRRWISYEHAFPTKRVRLHFFRVEGYSGTPQGREGQRLAWIDPAAPSVAPVLPSNGRVLTALALPPLAYVPQSKDHGGPQGLLDHLQHVLRHWPLTLVLDEAAMAPDQRVALSRRVGLLALHYGAPVLLAGSAMAAQRAGLPGVLSRASDLRTLGARPNVKLWAVSCHDEADLAKAAALGADAAFLSPVLPTPSEPREPIGWHQFQRLAEASTIPVFAQGGLTTALLGRAQEASGAGIVVSKIDRPPDTDFSTRH
jgi:8-oxo-dGTP diphosphatase